MNSDKIGTGWSFPPSFKGGQAEMVSGRQEIRQALEIILKTVRGERFLRPDFGVGLQEYQFLTLSTAMKLRLQELITDEIRMQERRVEVENVDVSEVGQDGKLAITVTYTTRESVVSESLSVTIF